MKDIKDLLEEFSQLAIDGHKFTLDGNYKQRNKIAKKTVKVYEEIKKQGEQEELLQLIYSDIPEVASLSAVYCLRYNPEKCLVVLQKLSKQNIPFISSGAVYAIRNWNNNEWYID